LGDQLHVLCLSETLFATGSNRRCGVFNGSFFLIIDGGADNCEHAIRG
jgi:hypothetical protein